MTEQNVALSGALTPVKKVIWSLGMTPVVIVG